MKAWKLLLAAAACLSFAACKTDPNIVLLERELRLQEDEIYRLQDCVDDAEQELESCRRENATLRRRLEGDRSDREFDYSKSSSGGRSGLFSNLLPKGGDKPPAARPKPSDLPDVELPPTEPGKSGSTPGRREPGATAPSAPPAGRPPVRTQPSATDLDGAKPGAGLGALFRGDNLPQVVAGESRQVAKIELNRALTGGYKQKNRYGHEGVLVVLEPRDAQGRILAAPADLSIVVIDPKIEGEGGRIARWDFAAAETEPLFHTTGLGRGLQVELPWPAEPPQHRDLQLFVRYTTSDGRKLQAEKPIQVELVGDMPRGQPPAEGGPADGPRLGLAQPGDNWRPSTAPPSDAAMGLSPPSGPRTVEPAPRIGANADEREPPLDGTDDRDAEPPLRRPVAPEKKPPAGLKRPTWSPDRKP